MKNEPWVSPTDCVWKHDTLCRPTLALRRRSPGLERNAGCRRAWQHRVSLWPAGVAKTDKRLVQVQHHVCYKWVFTEKGLPDVSSPSVMLNLPNPHQHLPLCATGLYGIVQCQLPVSSCGCCCGRSWRVLSVPRHGLSVFLFLFGDLQRLIVNMPVLPVRLLPSEPRRATT